MSPKEFVVAKMKELVKEFDSVKTSYSFHELSDTHSIEIIPSDLYHNNEDFKDWEVEFVYEFMNQFPNDSICVLTEDSIIPIENIEFSYEGDAYFKTMMCLPEISSLFTENEIYVPLSIFDTHRPLIEGEYSFNQRLIDINSLPTIFNQDFKVSSFSTTNSSLGNYQSNITDVEVNGENDYSFAA